MTVLLSNFGLRDIETGTCVSFLVTNFGNQLRESWSNESVDESMILTSHWCFRTLLIRIFYSCKVCTMQSAFSNLNR